MNQSTEEGLINFFAIEIELDRDTEEIKLSD